jgi:ribosome-interacting GTPase 1
MGIDEEIEDIQEEIRETPYNKSTEHHIGKLKAKLAKLKEEKKKREAAGDSTGGYAVQQTGHATVGLVGFPSVGKSTLLNAVTNAESEVGAYEFTTLEVVPGMMKHRNAEIQVLDLPGLIHGAAANRGRGKEVIGVARTADLIAIVLDPFNPDQLDVVEDELHQAGIRINEDPPEVRVSRTRGQGGIDVQFTVEPTHLDEDLAEEILDEWGYVNTTCVIREDVTPDQLVDALADNRAYVPGIVVVNKVDAADDAIVQERVDQARERGYPTVAISADADRNLEAFTDLVYRELDLIRIYLKPQGGEADMDEPLVVRSGATVGDVCDHLHRAMRRKFRYAEVTGDSSKFPNQQVGLDHTLEDEDILTLVTEGP